MFLKINTYINTVWSEGFLYKVAPPELKISPIMYFVIHNSVVLSKILKIVVPFWPCLSMSIIIKIINFIESKIKFSKFFSYGTTIFNILDNTTELWMTKYIIGQFFSSGGATLYKNPSVQTVLTAQVSFAFMFFLLILILSGYHNNVFPAVFYDHNIF